MLPEIANIQNLALGHSKSFNDMLCDEYYFDVKRNIHQNPGTRFLFYDQKESTLLISHVSNGRVHLINLKNGKMRWFDHHLNTVRSVQTTGRNSEIVTASWDGTCMVTSFDTLEKRLILTENDMGRSPYIAVSQQNDFVYSYSYDSDKNPERKSNTVRKWNLADGRLVQKIILSDAHLAQRRCGSVEAYLGKLYVVSDTGYLEIYDLNTGKLVVKQFFNDLLPTLCIIPSLNMIALSGDNGDIYICSVAGKLVTKIKAHNYYISEIMVHPNKPDTLLSVSHDGTLKIWKLSKLKNLLWPKLELELIVTIRVKNYESLWTVTVCNDLILCGGDRGEIEIYNIKNTTAEFAGKLFVFNNNQFAMIPADKKKFFASDLSLIQVRQKIDGRPVYGQLADYLLKTTCDFKIFRDLFSENQEDLLGLKNQSKGYFQLTK